MMPAVWSAGCAADREAGQVMTAEMVIATAETGPVGKNDGTDMTGQT